MELRQLRYFVRLADTLHFGRAAEKEFIAQSVISAQIAALELDLGFRLFDRSSRQVTLTLAGQTFLIDAQRTLALLKSAVDQARDVAEGRRRLRVGIFGEGAGPLTHLILSSFHATMPAVELQYVELTMVNQLEAVASGDVDVALLRMPISQPGFRVDPLFSEPRVVGVPAHDELADAASLSVGDLLDRPFAVAASGSPEEWRSYWSFDVQRGEQSRVSGEVRSVTESLATIAYRGAVDTFPSTAAQLFPHPGVRFVPLTDAEPSSIALVSAAAPKTDDVVEAFRGVVLAVVDQHLNLVPGAVRLDRLE